MLTPNLLGRAGLLLFLLPIPAPAPAAPRPDDGMWTFDNPPLKRLKEVYGFEPTKEWLQHVQRASVRFNSGGSGSFVSPNGLVMTNHHVGADALEKASSKDRDLMKDGFLAATPADEIKCADLELNVLISLENVTDQVAGAVKEGMDDKAAADARQKAIAAIEKEEKEKTGLRCNVIPLYQGAEYALHRMKKYTDIRIVCAPEKQMAFFGGDPDNFTYPRYDLDFAFFRVYEDGKPIKSPDYFRWSAAGAKENELVFVSGNPGSTGRLDPIAKMEYFRDVSYPGNLRSFARRIQALKEYATRSPEHARQAEGEIFGLENSQKAITGYLGGLHDPATMARRREEEDSIKNAGGPDVVAAYDQVAKARRTMREVFDEVLYGHLDGQLAGTALGIVRLVTEVEKPNGERLPPFRDSSLDSTKFSLFSPAPIYPEMDEIMLSLVLQGAAENLGPDHEFVKAALQGKDAREVATQAVRNTKVADVEFRKQLVEGGVAAVKQSQDPMIQLALRVEPLIRATQRKVDEQVIAVETSAMEKIAKARFKAFGKTIAPDATFTLRLSYGAVKGYEQGTTWVPYKTTYYGLFERHAANDGKQPWELSPKFMERKGRIDLATPLNFVCTTDIIGGNSGSPVLNRNAEIVGLIFDGNIQSLGNRFVYDEKVARAVAVHSSGITEALAKVYDANDLLGELLGKTPATPVDRGGSGGGK